MPKFFFPTTFLDQPCGSGPAHGVNPELQRRLLAADDVLRATFSGLPPDRRIDPSTGHGDASFAQWSATVGPHVCWLPNAGHHSAGAAIDINPAANPYVVTRNGGTPGGEPGAENLVEVRHRVLAVYDRAMQFVTSPDTTADVSARAGNESTRSVWSRFKAVSDALVSYLNLAVDWRAARIARVAIANADDISDGELVATIPESERHPLDLVLNNIDELL